MTVRHYTGVRDLDRAETLAVLRLARKLKAKWRDKHQPSKRLRGYTLAGIYEKPSLRTRVTFEAGMTQLGGHAVYLGPDDIRLGQRESIADVARNLSRLVQIITARTSSQSSVDELAANSDVPVINALSDREHPCQALADFLTIQERFEDIRGRKIAFIGDGNNVAHSLLLMGALLGASVTVAGPAGFTPDAMVVEQARGLAEASGAGIVVTPEPRLAVAGADVVYTDVWTSMGQEAEREARLAAFAPYQITEELLAATGKPHSVLMHCLPAHRGEEVTAAALDGTQSVIFDQAENRLHVQKALMLFLLGR
ncbi:MAG TPA: ornithine carbamoyltransferase [Herpetosiphonaceae bacterium]|nr:ornithine carbamoyltransferase [Herpetosiphonaceae bacterium]